VACSWVVWGAVVVCGAEVGVAWAQDVSAMAATNKIENIVYSELFLNIDTPLDMLNVG
jgi:hypothetical protein